MTPKIIRMTQAEWRDMGRKLYGKNIFKWKFKCPSCGHVQTAEDFRLYRDKGANSDDVRSQCIGRFDGNINTPMLTGKQPCNYSAHGLFDISPIRVKIGDREVSSFAFADQEVTHG